MRSTTNVCLLISSECHRFESASQRFLLARTDTSIETCRNKVCAYAQTEESQIATLEFHSLYNGLAKAARQVAGGRTTAVISYLGDGIWRDIPGKRAHSNES